VMAVGARCAVALRRTVVIVGVAFESGLRHREQGVMAGDAAALGIQNVLVVVELYVTEPVGVDQVPRQTHGRSGRFGCWVHVAPQAVASGREGRTRGAMARAAGRPVGFRRLVQVVGVMQQAFRQREDPVVAGLAVAVLQLDVMFMVEARRSKTRLHIWQIRDAADAAGRSHARLPQPDVATRTVVGGGKRRSARVVTPGAGASRRFRRPVQISAVVQVGGSHGEELVVTTDASSSGAICVPGMIEGCRSQRRSELHLPGQRTRL